MRQRQLQKADQRSETACRKTNFGIGNVRNIQTVVRLPVVRYATTNDYEHRSTR